MGDKRRKANENEQQQMPECKKARRAEQPKRVNKHNKNTKKKSHATDEVLNKQDYIYKDEVMYVKPYVFEFNCFYRPRWKDQTILSVFIREFRHMSETYWRREFSSGRMLCNGEKITDTMIWKDGQQVKHIVHRHESAVYYPKPHGIQIVRNTNDYIVVSKPVSMPVHACGTYRKNCLQFLLQVFHGFYPLYAVHRLDKETSGLVIFAKNSETAAQFSTQIQDHKVQKTYLAEVYGYFPSTSTEKQESNSDAAYTQQCNARLFWDKREMKSVVSEENGVEAVTHFKVIGRNQKAGTSFVECRPKTGRTHQIRVHLAHLGFPIVNDPLYGRGYDDAKGDSKSECQTKTIEQLFNHQTLSSVTLQTPRFCDLINDNEQVNEWCAEQRDKHGRHLSVEEEGKLLDCLNCPQVTNVKNVEYHNMFIHLHALRYEGEGWDFQVDPPKWMSESQEEDKDKDHDKEETSNKWNLCCTS